MIRSGIMTAVLIFVVWMACGIRVDVTGTIRSLFEEYGVMAAGKIMESWFPLERTVGKNETMFGKTRVISYLEGVMYQKKMSEDPAYERILAKEWEQTKINLEKIQEENSEQNLEQNLDQKTEESAGEVIAMKPAGHTVIREKLADYDYLIQNFYSIHPTTTAGRDLVNAETFLTMDFSLEKTSEPQILIYHTHSQEEFSDYPENPEATIVGVGAYLAECLREEGYQVVHDPTVYDVRDGKLDRSQAYTYALEGITGILQKYPSIEVVLDIHRDGVSENTRLVTEVNGKPTAKVMFFNGTSQTPDGPIEYLPNPNRTANLAFSFQMQLLAAEQYPGLTRKIYLKGLRYNQHVRARTALVEVGAQTNTYAEALHAMEPLADLLSQVLSGES